MEGWGLGGGGDGGVGLGGGGGGIKGLQRVALSASETAAWS